ncbi:hypothetical protein BGZ60DRAFT_132590 [Tricladium varicosporioides]|nr:hypothetical protein BGZ60DRAFT_132590 [Hymenoscyphus varicosporioides]
MRNGTNKDTEKFSQKKGLAARYDYLSSLTPSSFRVQVGAKNTYMPNVHVTPGSRQSIKYLGTQIRDEIEHYFGSHGLMQPVVLVFGGRGGRLVIQPKGKATIGGSDRPAISHSWHGSCKTLNQMRQACVNLLKLRIFSPLTPFIGFEHF